MGLEGYFPDRINAWDWLANETVYEVLVILLSPMKRPKKK
jgi:hypothetical protein